MCSGSPGAICTHPKGSEHPLTAARIGCVAGRIVGSTAPAGSVGWEAAVAADRVGGRPVGSAPEGPMNSARAPRPANPATTINPARPQAQPGILRPGLRLGAVPATATAGDGLPDRGAAAPPSGVSADGSAAASPGVPAARVVAGRALGSA